MNLVWKLLRQHISIPQFVGFFFANLFGMLIVLLGYQFYRDVMPVFTSEDSFMKSDYIIVSKKIGMGNTISGRTNTFSPAEVNDVENQPFASSVGTFTSTEYKVEANMGVNGVNVLNSELFFESIPDHFVLPKISDGLVGMINFDIFIHGNGHADRFKGKVIGFSSRLNTILVPQAFMDWSNNYFAPGSHSDPTRLIMQVDNPANEKVTKYIDQKGYEVEDDKLQAEKTTYFLRMIVTMVMVVGLVISVLSFYILMLSIYLLVQKNSSKLENLLLIGYSPSNVARPYQLLTIGLNSGVLLIAWATLYFVRDYYMGVIETLFPDIDSGTMLPAILLGVGLFALVSICNIIAIRHKIVSIWKRKE